MTISVRLDKDLEARLRRIADAEGLSLSEVIRRAADLYWQRHTDAALDVRLEDVIGKIASGGGRAARTGRAFRRVLGQRR